MDDFYEDLQSDLAQNTKILEGRFDPKDIYENISINEVQEFVRVQTKRYRKAEEGLYRGEIHPEIKGLYLDKLVGQATDGKLAMDEKNEEKK